MAAKLKVGWDITNKEFTITDDYYFSVLRRRLKEEDIVVREVDRWRDLQYFDVIVLNYPEDPFLSKETSFVKKLVQDGKRVLMFGYYKDEDRIAQYCNTLASVFGMRLLGNAVYDPVNNHNQEKYWVTTTQILRYKRGVRKVLLPCTGSIAIGKGATPVVKAEKTARCEPAWKSSNVLIAERTFSSGGSFLLGGTCVFWDNYSLELYDNYQFVINILKNIK